MHISEITVSNFRLLEDVGLCLEEDTTLIVGRNNSGKTSLTELFRRLLAENSPAFRLEDFSLGVHEQFWEALQKYKAGDGDEAVRAVLPSISVSLVLEYEDDEELGALSNFIVDLDDTCTKAKVVVTYKLGNGRIPALFADIDADRGECFRVLRERLPKLYSADIYAEDPNDPENTKDLESADLRAVLQFGFINAQRALDDASNKEKAVLGKVFERLFSSAASPGAGDTDRVRAENLRKGVESVQSQIDEDFNEQLSALAPTFELFGYPGLSDPRLRTETALDVKQLLSNHTTVSYTGPVPDGINLPESYNGLGSRNLIFILLKLFEYFRDFATRQSESGVHLVFIEEPEAHLHPQMQAVFIRKLDEIRAMFEEKYNDNNPWPVQFIVTTHSSHIANEASFDSMRYFLAAPREADSAILQTESRDLRTGLSGEEPLTRDFLHQYMTLTRCDLLFADGAILVEGTTERLILPKAIEKFDKNYSRNLGGLYLSIMEVGGAYAHLFYNLVDFLGLRTLVITDIDSVDANNGRSKCKVSCGTHSSNAGINNWFNPSDVANPTLAELQAKSAEEKVEGLRCLSFQVPENDGEACGRSFEDAFILANRGTFGIPDGSSEELESQAWDAADGLKKSEFALKYAIQETNWVTPRYIEDGLTWLSVVCSAESASAPAEEELPDA